MADRINK